MLGKVSHGACSERSPLGSFAQLAHSPRIQPADGHYHSTNYLQRERAKKDGAEQEYFVRTWVILNTLAAVPLSYSSSTSRRIESPGSQQQQRSLLD